MNVSRCRRCGTIRAAAVRPWCKCGGEFETLQEVELNGKPIDSINAALPAPVNCDGPAVWDLVIADMKERDELGAAKYKTRLRAHNGRPHITDAYQEALDLSVYLRAEIIIRKEMEARIAYLEEAVRVRDTRACAQHWMQAPGDERYMDCQYCGEHPGCCLDDCPTVTHPLEGQNANS